MFGRLIDKQMGSGRFRAVSLKALAATTRRLRLPGSVRLTERIHSPKPGEGIETIVSRKDGTWLNIDTSDFIERQVFFHGTYEPEVARVIKEHLSDTSTAIDVGANVGIHTLTMAKVASVGTVIACEPHPGVRSRLVTNLALNSIQNVSVVDKAIGDRVGIVSLHEPNDVSNPGMASLLPLGDWSALEVESTTLDDLVKSESPGAIDLIKIDVEGLEGAVLAGAAELLARDRPTLVFEYGLDYWSRAGYRLEDVLGDLRAAGYDSILVIGKGGPAPIKSSMESGNLLAYSSSRGVTA